MVLDIIKLQTTWNDAAGSINSNFTKIQQVLQGAGIASYVHVQNEASNEWSIAHNLGKYPSVTVVDSAGSVVYGDVVYDSDHRLTVRFTSAFSGKAYLN